MELKQRELEEKEKKKAQREEEKLKKLEEKRKIEEEKLEMKEKEKRKQEKQQQVLLNFIKKEPKPNDSISSSHDLSISNSEASTSIFLPFQLKPNQKLAELVPSFIKESFNKNGFDEIIAQQNREFHQLYLQELKERKRTNKSFKNSKKSIDGSSDVIIIEEDDKKLYRAKLLQFRENTRPPYFGTFRKKSLFISGRRPFHKDDGLFNYDVDSDEEWEEEEEGEEIKDSESEKSVDENEKYEIDDFFVPHGYLSDDEQEGANEDGTESDKPEMLLKEDILIEERRKVLKPLKPIVIGCCWTENKENNGISTQNAAILEQYRAIFHNVS
ncbi:chromatin assembly factor 1 subunit A-like protein [Dinothrombium tinctorium]|uniref:Chromatin assembly factor 1 subunit A-like protein n=1 Tax=Dinothrombium tinctorium TaxID=1965070 RepID=A0A3S3NXM3_9ACAR|nr:chromatin assembly factor 1 subunit A-like protein [Dinothrombium tinctorium]